MPNKFLGKGAKRGGKFDVYIDGKVLEAENREEADKMLAAAKGEPVTKSRSQQAKTAAKEDTTE